MASQSRKEQIEAMLQDDPNDPFLRYGLAMEYVSAGEDDQAVRCFRELLAVEATYVPAYLQAGQALVRLNRLAEARDIWQGGIAVARQNGDQHAAEEMTGMLEGLE